MVRLRGRKSSSFKKNILRVLIKCYEHNAIMLISLRLVLPVFELYINGIKQ